MADEHHDELGPCIATSCPASSTSRRSSGRTSSLTTAGGASRASSISASRSLCFLLWLGYADGGVLVNDGFLYVAIFLALVGVYCITSGWHLGIDEKGALVAASKAVGFPVGHASAQLGWRGLRSRPTWRILLYSAEEPPTRRGFVLVDAVDGRIVDHFTEENPEEWPASGLIGLPEPGSARRRSSGRTSRMNDPSPPGPGCEA